MEKQKIDEAKILFWNRFDLTVKIGSKEISWAGWQAALMHAFIIAGAAMTSGGALEIVLAGGLAQVDPKTVGRFITEMHKEGLLKYHYERRKAGKRRRIYRSTLQPEQFMYQRIVHEEEE